MRCADVSQSDAGYGREDFRFEKKYWGDKTVILHSRDIRKCDKEFKILFDLDIKRRFYEDIDALLAEKDATASQSI